MKIKNRHFECHDKREREQEREKKFREVSSYLCNYEFRTFGKYHDDCRDEKNGKGKPEMEKKIKNNKEKEEVIPFSFTLTLCKSIGFIIEP